MLAVACAVRSNESCWTVALASDALDIAQDLGGCYVCPGPVSERLKQGGVPLL